FYAKKGKSFDIDKIRESITATRLSGGTRMAVDSFEVTAMGELKLQGDQGVLLRVPGIERSFTLGEDKSAKGTLQNLRAALERGDKIASVTGQLPGWNGVFPKVLRALDGMSPEARNQLFLTSFEVQKK